jgi:cell division protein YceG involved in septum cleavage
MKGFIYTAIAVGSLVSLVGMSTAHAQITDRLQFKTSFPFTVGQTSLPAGTYMLEPASDMDLSVLKVSNGQHTAIMLTVPEGPQTGDPKDNAIIFNRYGDHYVLSEVWDADENSGAEPTGLPAERRHESRKEAERITLPLTKVS